MANLMNQIVIEDGKKKVQLINSFSMHFLWYLNWLKIQAWGTILWYIFGKKNGHNLTKIILIVIIIKEWRGSSAFYESKV